MMDFVPDSDPVLHGVAGRVLSPQYDDKLAELIAEMFLTLDAVPGAIALAAPQVGVPLRVVVYDLGNEARGHLVNPVITHRSRRQVSVTEGCLSFPGEVWSVRRHRSVETVHQDRFGKVHPSTWHGLAAQMVQHEVDHLNGILLPDVAIRRIQKLPLASSRRL